MRQAAVTVIKYVMLPFGMIHAILRGQNRLTVLMYHRVNDFVCKELAVTERNFLWQMEYLSRKGFRIVSLDEAAALVKDEKAEGRNADKYAVLTFDDGYEDFYTTAFPILLRYGYPAAIYVVPGCMEMNRTFWWDLDLGESRLMDWKQVEELAGTGLVTVGSHTMTHPDLSQIGPDEVRREMIESRNLLQEKLSTPIAHFSYPRGIVTPFSKEVARSIYRTAVSIFDGQGDDLLQWKRIPAQRSDGKLLFAARLKGWLILEEWIRKVLYGR